MQSNDKQLTELSDDELLQQKKKLKSEKISNAVILGFMVGVAVFSTWRNGFGLFTFFPLLFVPFALNHTKKVSALEAELRARNLS
ncbi:hypothetical protein [Sphingobacterium hungaricum]|uniref:FUSC family protein n=1 Tax=Sphingobacterium hungaricum TaxID=2082723 RepID=A0A928UYP2_9SPHI|nr:hypothetical protein [Sphingobacterium hungaricum]MBE8714468.1 FUSC family protein [Sphingobacterium hungaricum]